GFLIMFLTSVEETNCPTLLRIGAIASLFNRGCMVSNSLTQKLVSTLSFNLSKTFFRKASLVKISGTIKSVAFGMSITLKMAYLKIYSRRGPQESAYNLWKIATIPETT